MNNMKYLLITVLIAMLFKDGDGVENSLREKCLRLKPVKHLTAIASSSRREGDWMLRRVTRTHESELYVSQENLCSITNYRPDCRAIRFEQIIKTGVTLAFSEKYQQLLRTFSKRIYQDTEYVIIRERITRMENISVKKIVSQVDWYIRPDDSLWYVLVAIAPHGGWSILRTCDEKVSWVKVFVPFEFLIQDAEVQRILDVYDREIDDKLDELGIEKSTMETVPLFFPKQWHTLTEVNVVLPTPYF